MRIVLATSLYPPDIGEPAPYIKELARRLSGTHQVTIVAYTRLPEEVPGVKIIAVSKRYWLPLRILIYTLKLFAATWSADILYAENGTSTELPATIVAVLTRIHFIFHIGDVPAHTWVRDHAVRSIIEHSASRTARTVLTDKPLPRPEILPFVPYPTEAVAQYEKSWADHLLVLNKIFHATN